MANFDERAFVARLEEASVEALAQLLAHPTAPEEQALRQYLGDARYQRMHALAVRRAGRGPDGGARGNVIVLHDLMGGELTGFDSLGAREHLWLEMRRLVGGELSRLVLDGDGQTASDPRWSVRASGIVKRYYGEILLHLSLRWNVEAFWYDWRKDLNLAAAELAARIAGWLPPGAPVHLVAHGMGGLVARTFVMNHRHAWMERAGRLVMLGTPQHGTFAIAQALAGIAPLVRNLALVDPTRDAEMPRRVLATFPGVLQLLPSPLADPGARSLYESATYGDLGVSQAHLDAALRHHEKLRKVVDPRRMVCVAGARQRTPEGLEPSAKARAVRWTDAGDGWVTHALGRLAVAGGREVPTYYVAEPHARLIESDVVLAALDDLLERGETRRLSPTAPAQGRTAARRPSAASLESENDPLSHLARRLRAQARTRTTPQASAQLSTDERSAEDLLLRGLLGGVESESALSVTAGPRRMPRIAVRLECRAIEDAHRLAGDVPVDAIAVGHYVGVRPQAAELALDQALSAAIAGHPARRGPIPPSRLLLTQYTDRGTIRGELGQPFLLPDPRPRSPGSARDRVIAIAGMGVPARFGAPELAVLVRELLWSLGRLGCRHLATVLIGSGNGNLVERDSVAAWLRGARHALSGVTVAALGGVPRITFVEVDPGRVARVDQALRAEAKRLKDSGLLRVEYEPPTAEELKRSGRRRARRRAAAPGELEVPTRITLSLQKDAYRYGALTETATVPEREVEIDPAIVREANAALVAAGDAEAQYRAGLFMGGLLFPSDLRRMLRSRAPLVMLLDRTTARVHWEMVGRPEMDRPPAPPGVAPSDDERIEAFLGTAGGLTRQLRTVFAPPPEPPPPPQRLLRVLVVADPAEQAPLPGAEEEGIAVADLFESFNADPSRPRGSRVEVVRLFGPSEATRVRVLQELMGRTYDVLHFAGHCFYDAENPQASGWIFTGGTLAARELSRIDRIPRFVFSNACESGITADRPQRRSENLAPSFAEAFFARGVGNFVCTAWPVDDRAALEFAKIVYASLLGLGGEPRSGTQAMHVAMREARCAIARRGYGIQTWGAYQHYGNPFFRLFEANPRPPAAPGATTRRTQRPSRAVASAGRDRSGPALRVAR